MTRYYCSTFSKGYAYKGLLLYNSLLRWDRDFHFFIICLSDEVEQLFAKMNLQNATLIPLAAVEQADPQLLAVKSSRNEQEYAWTSKASVMLYLFNNFAIDHILWLDGDTYFFSSPEPIFNLWGEYSIMLNEGQWSKGEESKIERFGRFNTGLMGFKKDKNALRCLHWFRRSLIKWCYAKHEKKLWSDQVYANDWPQRFKNVGVIKSMGINVTPPMIVDNEVSYDGTHLSIAGERLVFFHYSQFRYFDGNEFDLCGFVKNLSDKVLKLIYLPYIQACNEIMAQIQIVDKDFYIKNKTKGQLIKNYFNLAANERTADRSYNICTLLSKDYLVQGLALYNSLQRFNGNFHFWILCVDDIAYKLLEKLNLNNVTLVSLDNIRTKKLARIQRKRQAYEFCWSIKALFANYVLKNNYNIDSLLYIDADIYFFQDPFAIYREWGDASVYITRLWHSPKWEQRLGKYSGGLVGFKRDESGLRCLKSWMKDCLRWCYDRQEYGLWGDQKYLDEWPHSFDDVKISANRGINAGSWNLKKGSEVQLKDDAIFFDDTQLVCFHYSGFRIINENQFNYCQYSKRAAKAKEIYAPYVAEIRKIIARIKALDSSFIKIISTEGSRCQ